VKHPLKATHQLSDFKGICKRATDMQSTALCEEKNLDKKIDMRYKSHMKIGEVLLGLIAKEGRSFRRISIDLKVDRSTLYRSLKKGNPEWKTINKLLDYLGYEVQIVKSKRKSGIRKG
jgi:hypothetical protein